MRNTSSSSPERSIDGKGDAAQEAALQEEADLLERLSLASESEAPPPAEASLKRFRKDWNV